jgi:hypothetical protein
MVFTCTDKQNYSLVKSFIVLVTVGFCTKLTLCCSSVLIFHRLCFNRCLKNFLQRHLYSKLVRLSLSPLSNIFELACPSRVEPCILQNYSCKMFHSIGPKSDSFEITIRSEKTTNSLFVCFCFTIFRTFLKVNLQWQKCLQISGQNCPQ